MSAFLASVRNVEEAAIAHRIGADWIDLKEPASGALGAVDPQTVVEVVQWLRRQKRAVSLSATIGDCWDSPLLMPPRVELLHAAGVEYAKIGIFSQSPSRELLGVIQNCCSVGPKIVLVCFAEAPPSTADMGALATTGIAGAMLDTAGKTGPSLTGLLSIEGLTEFVSSVHRYNLICGLAGSLTLNDIGQLSPLGPDYLGFRGALCRNAIRESEFSEFAASQVRAAIDSIGNRDDGVKIELIEPHVTDARSNREH